MVKIIPPKKYATPEFMAAVNFNHLFNAFLEEEAKLLKEAEPECPVLLPEQTLFHLKLIRDSLSLENQATSISEILTAPEEVLMATGRDFFRVPEMALFTTDVWLFFLALDFRNGQMRMVSDQMIAMFPEIFEPTIVFGHDVIKVLASIEKTLPRGEKIPVQARSILPLIAA